MSDLVSAFPRTRTRIFVEIDLDPVPGWGHNPTDHVQYVTDLLERSVPHYHPTVELDASTTIIRIIQAEGQKAIHTSELWRCEKRYPEQPDLPLSLGGCQYYAGDWSRDNCLNCGKPEERK